MWRQNGGPPATVKQVGALTPTNERITKVTHSPESSPGLKPVNHQCKVTVNPSGGLTPPPDRRSLLIRAVIAVLTLASTVLWIVWGGDSPQVAVTLIEVVV